MEPIFDRLGMVLVTANRAQGGMGTIQSALAGVSIYGDADVMLWDSSMTEKDGKAQDLFFRQALLAGERVPVLLDLGGGKGAVDALKNSVGAHVGGLNRNDIMPKFKNTQINFAEKKYNAACWTERVDVDAGVQYDKFGGQASWHPGNWVHQSTARKISLLFLHALDKALTMWELAVASDGGNPIDGKHWHLQSEEDEIRNKLLNTPGNATQCGGLISFAPRACSTRMRGVGEWTPRNDPENTSIRSIAKPAPDGQAVGILPMDEEMYPGRDPHMPHQRVPKGEVDVAMIARSLPPLNEGGGKRLLSSPSTQHQRRQMRRLTEQAHHGRKLNSTKIVPGLGWYSDGHPIGFCDGTSNAVCKRPKSEHCVMSGHNDARGDLMGDALSGWLVLQLKDIKEGLLMGRTETWHQYNIVKKTEGWTAVNNGRVDERRRKLKKAPPPLPEDFRWEVAVDGVIVNSWNKTEFGSQCHYISYNNAICKFWDDEEWGKKNGPRDVEVAMRIVSAGGRTAVAGITQLYFA